MEPLEDRHQAPRTSLEPLGPDFSVTGIAQLLFCLNQCGLDFYYLQLKGSDT